MQETVKKMMNLQTLWFVGHICSVLAAVSWFLQARNYYWVYYGQLVAYVVILYKNYKVQKIGDLMTQDMAQKLIFDENGEIAFNLLVHYFALAVVLALLKKGNF
jgi:hypothetical protein